MKAINQIGIALLAALTLALASCEDDHDSNPTLKIPESFTLNAPNAATVYDLEKSKTVELTCTQPDYGFTAATVYTVQVSLDNDFKDKAKFMALPTTYTKAKMAVDANEIAVVQTTLALDKGKTEADFPLTSKLYIRLKATLPNGKAEVYSNVISLNARTKFALDPIAAPKTMYVIGSSKAIGEWKWGGCVPMVQTVAQDGTFWRIFYFDAGTAMKFNAEKKFDGNEFGSSATLVDNASAGLSDDGGNLKVAKAGWYLVVIKTAVKGRDLKYTINFEKPNVYLIGDVSIGGKWETTSENLFTIPTTADGKFVSPAFAKTGEVRMCVKIEGEEWWHSEFIVLAEGDILYRGAGGDQDRSTQNAGKKAYLNFMTGKGEYK